jgi:lipoprotein-anchoring transpeptidase ErfK/SrfK
MSDVVTMDAPAAAMSRRLFLIGAAAALASCTTSGGPAGYPLGYADYNQIYGPVPDEQFPIPAVDLSVVPPEFYRRTVMVPSHVPNEPGIIVVDPGARYLYLIQDGGTAIRYGVGVGREGFAWNGDATIKDKQKWPTWHPPAEMVARDPNARPWANGMPPGLNNPLGARALYLWQGNRDTLYRLHGTNQPSSIGKAMSSGCVRMLNQDVIDLYERVPLGTKVTVLPA